MNVDRLILFVKIANFGSYKKASDELGISPPGLIKSIKVLEKSLNLELFKRHWRGVNLTKEGKEIYNIALEICNKVEKIEKRISLRDYRLDESLSNQEITIVSSIGMTEDWMPHVVADLSRKYPDLQINLLGHKKNLEDFYYSADIVISPFITNSTEIIQKPYVEFNFKYYSTHKYIEKNGIPKSIEDLKNHRIINFMSDMSAPFHSTKIDAEKFNIQANLGHSIFLLTKLSMGISLLAENIASSDKANFVDLFPDKIINTVPTFFSYAREKDKFKYIHELYDFFIENIPKF